MCQSLVGGCKDQLVGASGRGHVAASMAESDVRKVEEQRHWSVTVQPRDFVLDTERVAGELAATLEAPVFKTLNEGEQEVLKQSVGRRSIVHAELLELLRPPVPWLIPHTVIVAGSR
jgi:hypothetical protein